MQPIQTKEKIKEQCFHLLLSKGYDGVSISDIQKATGISRGLLYHYFGNKDALFQEVTSTYCLDLLTIDMEVVKDFGVHDMSGYILQKYQKLTDETLCNVSILDYDYLFYRVMQENEAFAKEYEEQRNNELLAWQIAVKKSQQMGEIREDVSTENIALQYLYITDGVWLRAISPTIKIDLCETLKEAMRTLYTFIKK